MTTENRSQPNSQFQNQIVLFPPGNQKEKSAEKKSETNTLSWPGQQFQHFYYIPLRALPPPAEFPSRVLLYDVDRTLIEDRDPSKKSSRPVFLYEQRLKATLEKAKKHNVMLGIVTSREYTDTEKRGIHPRTIKKIVKTLGEHYFNFVFFTAGSHKYFALVDVANYFFKNDPQGQAKVCLIDDQEEMITELASNGFNQCLLVNPDGSHLDKIDQFIEGRAVQHTPVSTLTYQRSNN